MKKSRAFYLAIFVGASFFTTSISQRIWPEQAQVIHGAYRFVSETTEIKSPKSSKIVRSAPSWKGMYFFDNGHFSMTLEDQGRKDDWLSEFPKNLKELGYQSFTGRYEMNGSKLELKPEIALNNFADSRPRDFTVVVDAERLMLTEILVPYTENTTEGTRVTILEKVNN